MRVMIQFGAQCVCKYLHRLYIYTQCFKGGGENASSITDNVESRKQSSERQLVQPRSVLKSQESSLKVVK